MRRSEGFTTVELIVTMVIAGIMAAVILPRLTDGGDSDGLLFGDRVVGGLRLAQKTAVAHRRLVCVDTAAAALRLRMAAANPSATVPVCTLGLTGAIDADYTTTDAAVAIAGATSPVDAEIANLVGRTLFFQPNGNVTLDAAGNTPARGNITVSVRGRAARTIMVEGSTGYVDFLR